MQLQFQMLRQWSLSIFHLHHRHSIKNFKHFLGYILCLGMCLLTIPEVFAAQVKVISVTLSNNSIKINLDSCPEYRIYPMPALNRLLVEIKNGITNVEPINYGKQAVLKSVSFQNGPKQLQINLDLQQAIQLKEHYTSSLEQGSCSIIIRYTNISEDKSTPVSEPKTSTTNPKPSQPSARPSTNAVTKPVAKSSSSSQPQPQSVNTTASLEDFIGKYALSEQDYPTPSAQAKNQDEIANLLNNLTTNTTSTPSPTSKEAIENELLEQDSSMFNNLDIGQLVDKATAQIKGVKSPKPVASPETITISKKNSTDANLQLPDNFIVAQRQKFAAQPPKTITTTTVPAPQPLKTKPLGQVTTTGNSPFQKTRLPAPRRSQVYTVKNTDNQRNASNHKTISSSKQKALNNLNNSITPLRAVPKNGKKIIVIDAGHGGKDPGAIGVSGTKEKYLTLSYAQEIRDRLQRQYGKEFIVILTRDRDVFIPLSGRVKIARDVRADLFISIHADSNPNSNAHGLSVYSLSSTASDRETAQLAARENAADRIGGISFNTAHRDTFKTLLDLSRTSTMNASHRLAETIKYNMLSYDILAKRPHRYAGFTVLTAPDVPSTLVEIGFLSNRRDERRLRSSQYRQQVSSAIVKSIRQYFH